MIALLDNTALLYLVIPLLGLLVGSFLNVVIHRLPLIMQREWQRECAALQDQPVTDEAPFNLCVPRSRCPHCEHTLAASDNIPLLSWLWLKGRCRYCQAPVSRRYPLVELASALLAAITLWRFGAGPQLLAALVFSWMLLCMTLIDLDHLLLPDQLTLPLLWLGLLLNINELFVPLQSAVIGAAAGYGILWSLYWLFRLATGKEGMGYGDFKLLAAIGAWFGWQSLLPVLLLASFTGAALGLGLMALRRLGEDRVLPFGPALALGGWSYLMWGTDVVKLYWRLAL
ncbi:MULTISPECIES: prepilin peptidase [Oceanimonas]|uniref:Prepilin leader peptidase/N-methyltransferase n=1 Tax=Oceanimonas doudoroffii TaxID=84158 RepID=A0A233RJM5_9GAMM|nr:MULTISPECIES: A24 family peptidase [Oceanimonas]NHH99815.1 Type 4 prepilin-like proteins leader peptide-processing enzyme [Oceanimonas sp. MB9]OXY83593.1 prepilin peptidase [Oceanimonas doudoroffii]